MAKLIGELLFAIVRDLVEDEVNSIFRRVVQNVGAWLDRKIKGRTRLIVGLLLGFAAAGFWPLTGLLLAH